jgi:ketosteroid isomerase-like protein
MNGPFKSLRAVTLLSCLLLAVVSLGAAPSADDAVRKADQEWARVFGARQLDPSVDMCVPTARVLAPNGPLAQGRDQIRQLFAGFFALPDLKITWQPDEVRVAKSGELAYTTGRYDMSFRGPDGKVVPDHGKYVTVWQKQQNGDWKVVVDCFNSDIPMPPPPS